MKPHEIRKILLVAKELGVKELSYQDLTVSFFDKRVKRKGAEVSSSPSDVIPTRSPDSTPLKALESPDLTSEGIPTEDEFMLMSSPFYDHMQMMKSLKDEATEEAFTN